MAKQGTPPRYVGGQAVMEGVMMRGARTWAVAVRLPDGEVEVKVEDAPTWAERYAHVPFVRGITTLGESLSLGFRALTWSATRQAPEDEEPLPGGAVKATMAAALVVFAAVFMVLPALAARGLEGLLGFTDGFWLHLGEGLLRLALFLGYVVAIGRLADVRRVFEYHGAEHKAIAAFENGAELTPDSADRFTTEHVRCGTNFLLTVMIVTMVVYSFFGRPGIPLLIASRVVAIPLVAAVSYEVIRFAAGHMRWRPVRWLMLPGLALQRLTTRPPSPDQLEVAIASLRAVLTAEQLAEVDARARPPAASPRVAFGTA